MARLGTTRFSWMTEEEVIREVARSSAPTELELELVTRLTALMTAYDAVDEENAELREQLDSLGMQ